MKGTDNQSALQRIINRRRNQALDRQDFWSLTRRLVTLIIVIWVLFTQIFSLTQVSGNAMFPAFKDGDLVLGFRLQQQYQKGDVVLYEQEGSLQVGRIAAREGDVVTLDETGTMLVNGTPQSGEILYPTFPKEGYTYPLRIPDGNVFILGDYRTQSRDSRDFGPVPMEDIHSKVITLLRRRGL